MGELAGILMIISAFATAINLFLIFYIIWEKIKLNECLSIYVWAARESVYASMDQWQELYGGKLTPEQILQIKAFEYNHTKDHNKKPYSKRDLLKYFKTHPDTEHINIFGYGTRSDGKPVGETKYRYDKESVV